MKYNIQLIPVIFLAFLLGCGLFKDSHKYKKLLYPFDQVHLGMEISDFKEQYKNMNFDDRGEVTADKYNKFHNDFGINLYRKIEAYPSSSPLFQEIELYFREDSVHKVLFYIELKSKFGIKFSEIKEYFQEIGYNSEAENGGDDSWVIKEEDYRIYLWQWYYDPKPCFVEISILKPGKVSE